MKIKVRHMVERPNADGSVRRYWVPSKSLRLLGFEQHTLPAEEGAAIARARALNEAADAARERRHTVAPRGPMTLHDLIGAYRASEFFLEKRAKTRQGYDDCIKRLEEWAGDMPLAVIDRDRVEKLYRARRKAAPVYAASIMRVGRLIFGWGRHKKLVAENPFEGQKVARGTARQPIWSHEAVAAVVAAADAMGAGSIGTAVALNEWFGQRAGDLVALSWAGRRDGGLRHVQSKTGVEVFLPFAGLPRPVLARLNRERRRWADRPVRPATILADDATGRPWSYGSFYRTFVEVRARAAADARDAGDADLAAELEKLQLLWLRHTAVTRFADEGVEVPDICAITGHSLQAGFDIVDRYMSKTRRMARRAVAQRRAGQDKA
jgi:hypothetical protein